jgi:hypothetical protein
MAVDAVVEPSVGLWMLIARVSRLYYNGGMNKLLPLDSVIAQ